MEFYIAGASFVLGLTLQTLLKRPEAFAAGLNQFVIWVAMPAMILRALPGLVIDQSLLLPVLTPWLLFAVAYVLVAISGAWLGWSSTERVAMTILVGLGNTAFLGVPYVGKLLGDAAISTAVLYDQLGSFLILSTVTMLMIAATQSAIESQRRGTAVSQPGWPFYRAMLLKIISFPPFCCLLASLFLPIEGLVLALDPLLSALALLILPIALLVVGIHFRLHLQRSDLSFLVLVGGYKLVVLPALVSVWVAIWGVPGVASSAVILQSAMPPMITPVLLLITAGIASRLTATLLGYLTLVGCLSVYLWSLVLARML